MPEATQVLRAGQANMMLFQGIRFAHSPYVFECNLELNIRQLYEDKHYTIDEDAKEIYYKLKEKYLDDEMLQFKNNNIFLEMTQKMQHEYCCTESKFEAVAEWLKTYEESKTIIFCKYIRSVDECRHRFPKSKSPKQPTIKPIKNLYEWHILTILIFRHSKKYLLTNECASAL